MQTDTSDNKAADSPLVGPKNLEPHEDNRRDDSSSKVGIWGRYFLILFRRLFPVVNRYTIIGSALVVVLIYMCTRVADYLSKTIFAARTEYMAAMSDGTVALKNRDYDTAFQKFETAGAAILPLAEQMIPLSANDQHVEARYWQAVAIFSRFLRTGSEADLSKTIAVLESTSVLNRRVSYGDFLFLVEI